MAKSTNKTSTLENEAYEKLRDEIFTGVYKPGTMLKEKQISDHLNISRTPVRTALQRLLFEKIVSEDATGHTFVARPTRKEVNEITEMRLALEPMIFNPPVTDKPEIAKKLEDILTEQKEADPYDKHGLITFSKLDCEFHCERATFSDNDLLIENIKSLNTMMMRCNILSGTLAFNIPEALNEHKEIISYIKKQKYDFARLALSKHIKKVNDRMFMNGEA